MHTDGLGQPSQFQTPSRAGGHNPVRRLGIAQDARLSASVSNTPDLPAIDWSLVGQEAPGQLPTPSGALPEAEAVVITWTTAEWAAMEHVFCSSTTSMPYGSRLKGSWTGWQQYSADLPSGAPSDWTYWGRSRLVQLGGHRVLLFKSNTHLDWPGESYLEQLIDTIIRQVQPGLIVSIGTAGGAQPTDHLGTVRAVSAATLDQTGQPPASWPTYTNAWAPPSTVLADPGFQKLLVPIPTTHDDLQNLCDQFNRKNHSTFALATLDPQGLAMGDPLPLIATQTGGGTSLLTTSTFVVGTTAGTYQAYACIEMDDAIIGRVCAGRGTAFGFVRNLSDPVQNASLPARVQGGWGSAVYDAYGFYTSYNGALAAWGLLMGQFHA